MMTGLIMLNIVNMCIFM